MTLYRMLAAQAERNPDAHALLQPGRPPVSFGSLVGEIVRIGGLLAAMDVRRGDRVGVIADRGIDTAAAMLGVMCSATCVPLHPDLAGAEAEAAMRRTGVKAVLRTSDAGVAAVRAAERIGLPVRSAASAHDGVTPAPHPDDVAVLLWTSGSTDRPKIVPISHAHYAARTKKSRLLLGLGSTDRCFNLMSLSYAHGLDTGLLTPLSAGGSVICPPAVDADTFAQCLVELGATWYTGGAAHHGAVVEWLRRRRDVVSGHRLRFVRSSAASLPDGVRADIERLLGVPVAEAYGASEAGTVCANPPAGPRKAGSVGVAQGGDVAIMDDGGELLPPGSEGEVVVRGATVIGGYEDDPDATREAFRDSWFHTGDVGVFDTDGYLTLTGRIKEMINRGGEKVSPAEVDAALRAHPAVADAVTFPIAHPTIGEEVLAAVTLASPGVTESQIREFVRGRLAAHKVPRRVLVVADIPTTDTGKPHRREAAQRFATLAGAPVAADGAGITPAQRAVLGIWRDVLGLQDVGIDDDFFLSGGDSLRAVEIVARIGSTLGVVLPASALAEAPTVRALTDRVERPEAASGTAVINPLGTRPPLFCVGGRGGILMQLFALIGHGLGRDQPLHGLRPPDEGWPEGISIEQIADRYTDTVREAQPSGPYRLLGSSFGGLMVFEIAVRLQKMGEEVDFLGMIDTAAPPFAWERGHVRQPVDESTGDELSWVTPNALGRVAGRNAVAHFRARRAHVVDARFDGVITYFYCEADGVTARRDRRRLWRRAATGGLRLLALPGLHGIGFAREPNLSVIVDGLRCCLDGSPPAGLRPAQVLGLRFRLARSDGGEALHASDGRTFVVDRKASAGEVDRFVVSATGVTVGGWAVDWEHREPARAIVVFAGGRYLGRGRTGVGRRDVGRIRRHPALATAGFVLRFQATTSRDAALRVFAVMDDGRAVELARAGVFTLALRRMHWYRRMARLVLLRWRDARGGRRNVFAYASSVWRAARSRRASRVNV